MYMKKCITIHVLLGNIRPRFTCRKMQILGASRGWAPWTSTRILPWNCCPPKCIAQWLTGIACDVYDRTRVPGQETKSMTGEGGGGINRAASPAASLSPRHWTELQFTIKFQNILTSASWFHAWTPALELQTNNATEITCSFQKSNIGDLHLTQLEEEPGNKITGLVKTWGEETLKLIWINQVNGWKEWYVESKEMFFFLNLDLSYRRY